jgi:hypothetical protein
MPVLSQDHFENLPRLPVCPARALPEIVSLLAMRFVSVRIPLAMAVSLAGRGDVQGGPGGMRAALHRAFGRGC